MSINLTCFRIASTFILSVAVLIVYANPVYSADTDHPLDPLNAAEIEKAVKILRASPNFPKNALFSTVQLREPAKEIVLNYKRGEGVQRAAFAVIFDRDKNETFEATVDLGSSKLVSWKKIPGVQPLVFMSEYEVLEELVKADARWQTAMRKRGISNFEDVAVDGWAAGQVSDEHKGRLLRGLSFFKGNAANYYGRPIIGILESKQNAPGRATWCTAIEHLANLLLKVLPFWG